MNNLAELRNLSIELSGIKQFVSPDRDRPEFGNKYVKMLFFFLHEGIFPTLRKYLAHKTPQKRFLTFITIVHNNKEYVNISTQFHDKAGHFVIKNIFYPNPGFDYDIISRDLEFYFSNFNQFAGTENTSVFSLDTKNAFSAELINNPVDTGYSSGLFIYGLGGYVKMFIIKHFRKFNKIACTDYKADLAESFSRKYKFRHYFVLPSETYGLISNTAKPYVIIATYHSDHATLAFEIFKANKNALIFIEKPPAVNTEDLHKLMEMYIEGAWLEMGFNRRYIGFNRYVKNAVKDKKMYITCSVKEVLINKNHWYLWPNQGTRITGNIVHWFDLANFWIDSIPVEMNVMADPQDNESSAISVLYKNGSILNITASDQGNSLRGVQEKIEIRFDEETIFINDYLSMTRIYQNGLKRKKTLVIRDKGHDAMYRKFIENIKTGGRSDYGFFDLARTTLMTYHASEMIKNNIRNMMIEDKVNVIINDYNTLRNRSRSEIK